MTLGEQRMNRRQIVVASAAAVAGIGVSGMVRSSLAQDASPEAGPGEGGGLPPIPAGAVVVAEGLWNPGDLAFGPDGTLYIAETGVAGGDPTAPPAAATPMADGSLPMGPAPAVPPRVSQVAPDGTQSVLTGETGGVGIGFYNGEVFVSQGGGSVGSGMTPQPAENTINAVDAATSAVRLVASLGQYEVDNNPDGLDVNPNLYGLGIATDGQIYVADAGGNTIYRVDAATGEFALFAVVPNLTDLTGATPTAEELAMQPGPRQPVPTSVVIDAGGNVVVALLGENLERAVDPLVRAGRDLLGRYLRAGDDRQCRARAGRAALRQPTDGGLRRRDAGAGGGDADQRRRLGRDRSRRAVLPARDRLRRGGEPLRRGQLDHLRPERPARPGAADRRDRAGGVTHPVECHAPRSLDRGAFFCVSMLVPGDANRRKPRFRRSRSSCPRAKTRTQAAVRCGRLAVVPIEPINRDCRTTHVGGGIIR